MKNPEKTGLSGKSRVCEVKSSCVQTVEMKKKENDRCLSVFISTALLIVTRPLPPSRVCAHCVCVCVYLYM